VAILQYLKRGLASMVGRAFDWLR